MSSETAEEMESSMPTEQQRFLEEVSELRHKLKGYTVIQYGSSFTAEAREPDRKRQLLDQLKLARRIRTTMESAADTIEKASDTDRLRFLADNSFHINELVSLTQAVGGGYVSGHDFNLQQQEQERRKKANESKVYDTVLNHLVSMADERDGVLKEPAVASKASPSSMKPANEKTNVRRRPSSSLASVPFGQSKKRQRLPTTKKRYAPPDEEYILDDGEFPAQEPVQTASRSKRRNVAARRCHNCKSSTSYFRRCNYWFVSGHKCGKVFCSKCLIQKYGEEEPNWDDAKCDKDWQLSIF